MSKDKTETVEPGSEDASVNAGLDLAEGDSIDGVGNVKPEHTDRGDVGIEFHDAVGGEGSDSASVSINPQEVLSGVSASQTEASLAAHHTADAVPADQGVGIVPGLGARLVGHGPDAQHRFSGTHDPDVDSPDHQWRTANVPLEACACGALRAAPL